MTRSTAPTTQAVRATNPPMTTASHPASARTDREARLARLKADHFDEATRPQRVERALKALDGPGPAVGLPPEVWKRIAEDAELGEAE